MRAAVVRGLALAAAALTPLAPASPQDRVDPAGLRGHLIVAGGGRLPDAVRQRFVELAGGEAAHVVLLPGASASADDPAERQQDVAWWHERFPRATFAVLHTRDRGEADTAAFVAPLREATGVWIGGGAQERLAQAYAGTRTERELLALLQRGGVIGGTSAGAAIQSRTMIQESKGDEPVVARGLDLLPFGIVDQHFLRRGRLPRLRRALALRPGHFGLGVDEATAVEVTGRTLHVLGDSEAVLLLPPGAGHSERRVDLAAGETADLVSWQRAALRRAEPAWPAALAAPRVANGALVLVGGGRIPRAVVDRFVELAGGAAARVVVVPSAMPDPRDEDPFAAQLRERGVHVTTLHCAHPDEATAERLQPLADATGVWFGGGRQWRLVDAFEGTPAIAAFHAVLARGGVIGGTSAGATIQGGFLVRGNPAGNADMWCEAYDRGFAFLPGVAVDQHFVARQRERDLQQLVAMLPQLVGLGIDEGTAAIVQGGELTVRGDGTLAVFDVREASPERRAAPLPVWLRDGDRWDLPAGKALN